jgi:hypothetical protein
VRPNDGLPELDQVGNRELGINVSAAARDGVAAAVRAALANADRVAYERQPERPDAFWTRAEAWTEG